MTNSPTNRTDEKKRVGAMVEKWFHYAPYKLSEFHDELTTIILKEIKRAERREREACAKVAGTHLLGDGILTYTPLTLRIKITNAIRNRRTT